MRFLSQKAVFFVHHVLWFFVKWITIKCGSQPALGGGNVSVNKLCICFSRANEWIREKKNYDNVEMWKVWRRHRRRIWLDTKNYTCRCTFECATEMERESDLHANNKYAKSNEKTVTSPVTLSIFHREYSSSCATMRRYSEPVIAVTFFSLLVEYKCRCRTYHTV